MIGRIVFGLYWLKNAYNHLFKSSTLVGYTQATAGLKSPGTARFAVVATGVLMAIGGLAFIFGVWVRLGILCLVVFLLGASFVMHAYWKEKDQMAKMNQNINFWKNIALAAALLVMLAIYPWPLPLF